MVKEPSLLEPLKFLCILEPAYSEYLKDPTVEELWRNMRYYKD